MKTQKQTDNTPKELIENVLALEKFLIFIDIFEEFGKSFFDKKNLKNYSSKTFQKGLKLIKLAVYELMCKKMADCFIFSSEYEEIQDFAKQKLQDIFKNKNRLVTEEFFSFIKDWGDVKFQILDPEEEKYSLPNQKIILKITKDNE